MDITVKLTPEFIRVYERLSPDLQDEAYEKILLFRNRSNHKQLKVHNLHGRLKNRYSFSVNYRYRIVFEFKEKNVAILKTIGDHDVYK